MCEGNATPRVSKATVDQTKGSCDPLSSNLKSSTACEKDSCRRSDSTAACSFSRSLKLTDHSWLPARGSISVPCENTEKTDNEHVDDCHQYSQAIAALQFAGIPTNNWGTEEGYRYAALNVSCKECSPIEDRPKAEEYRSERDVGEAGFVQFCGDDMQTTQYEQGWREQGRPNWPIGIETLGMGVHEIAHSHPEDQGKHSEGDRCAIHEMPTIAPPTGRSLWLLNT